MNHCVKSHTSSDSALTRSNERTGLQCHTGAYQSQEASFEIMHFISANLDQYFYLIPRRLRIFSPMNKRKQLVQLGCLVLSGLHYTFHRCKTHFMQPACTKPAVHEQSYTAVINKPIFVQSDDY